MYNLMGVCEAYHIVKNQNIDADLFFNIISKNSGSSRALNNRWFDLVNSNFTPGFTLRLARKDVKNALSMGDGVPLPMFSLLYSLMMAGRKYDEEDVNALRKIFE